MTEHEGPAPDPDRESARAERQAEREARRAERRADREQRRAERHRMRAEIHAHLGDELRDRIREELRQGIRRGARKWAFGFGDVGLGGDGAEASEVVERRFEVAGMPRLRVNNVSGETDITVGSAGEVLVRARKRVRGWSEDRARRLLENVEIRMEQDGDEILVEPRLFEQERGWLELFRGGRVAVDLDIRVPRDTHVEATTVSGELSVTGTRGQHELRSVSGDVNVSDVQGPMRLRTVSGDVSATAYAGQLEANSVSGDVEFERSGVRTPDIVTVSGDVGIDAVLVSGGADARVKTVSGDVELCMGEADAVIEFRSTSGDADVDMPAQVEKEGRRDRRIVLGSGGPGLRVKTVSGDLTIRASREERGEPETATADEAVPMAPPASAPDAVSGARAREVLERLARGEIGVDDAAAALDSERGG